MVRRGIVTSRTEAAAAIREGKVLVAGRPAVKASTMVLVDEPITMSAPARRFVSRGGEKLDAALERFAIDVSARLALDAGASTGGFTECLLARGASHVIAVDVGYGQLDWRLREDPRVTVLERTNARALDKEALPYRPSIVTADLSFISLATVVPALARCAEESATFVLLVKPQFEAGRSDVGEGGVVSDPDAWARSIRGVAAACAGAGVAARAVMCSPLLGPAGNAEFLLYGDRGRDDAELDLDAAIGAAVDEALTLRSARE